MARFRGTPQKAFWRSGLSERGNRGTQASTLLSIYADSSFFVSVYIPDQHSPAASRLLKQHALIWLTPLHRAEWAHAVARRLFQGDISNNEAQTLFNSFERDREARAWVEVGLPELAFERCVELAKQYATRVGMATFDTLHVASALELGAERFWTFDERQAKLARAVGLKA
jgi:predicted nucleic acid-binding protein